MTEQQEHAPWRERSLFLPAAGAMFGLIFYLLVDRGQTGFGWTEDRLRLAAGSAVIVSGIALALTIERVRWLWSLVFAGVVGLIAGAIFYSNGGPGGYASDEWQVVAILVAIAIAAPVFQTARDHGRWTPDYASAHAHAWGNVVLAGVGVLFAGISFLLTQLMGELFSLIGLDAVQELVRKEWFGWMVAGSAFGAAVAILRDRDRVLGILQHIVMTILSVLAPVLAIGLTLFVLSLPFTGLDPLWDRTSAPTPVRSHHGSSPAIGLTLFVLSLPFTGLDPLWDRTSATTPVLLACVIGAVLLANAIVGNSAAEESKLKLLRVSALLLCLAVLPLTAVAFTSTWLRVEQHGFTPERLWALVFVGTALAAGIAYALAVVIGRRDWMATLRRVNMQLALGVCAVAFLLALPLINFGAISTRNQIARLEAGKIAPEQFDWAALAFDFGPTGRRALAKLAASGSAPAAKMLAAKGRYEVFDVMEVAPPEPIDVRLRVRPASAKVPDELQQLAPRLCEGSGPCSLFWDEGEDEAIVTSHQCTSPPRHSDDSEDCDVTARVALLRNGRWFGPGVWMPASQDAAGQAKRERAARRIAEARGEVTIRTSTRRQVFVGDDPVGEPF